MTDKALNKQVGGDHYKDMAIQPIEYITANGMEYRAANVIKYISRYDKKNGLEDLEKVIHYTEMLIEELQNSKEEALTGYEDEEEGWSYWIPNYGGVVSCKTFVEYNSDVLIQQLKMKDSDVIVEYDSDYPYDWDEVEAFRYKRIN